MIHMSAISLDGAALAAKIESELTEQVHLLDKIGIVPGLAVIRVGNDPATQTYVERKEKACARVGIHSRQYHFDSSVSSDELRTLIQKLNESKEIHGILLQLPLPESIDPSPLLETITPEKDVDGLSAYHLGKLFHGENDLAPCTPKGIIRLLHEYKIELCGKHAVVIGRSNLMGKPMAAMLLQENATVTVCHSKTPDLATYTKQADILVVATGHANLITPEMVREGAVVIDVGIHHVNGKMCGDVDASTWEKASFMTPVPGGVGPLTVAMLLDNTVQAARNTSGKMGAKGKKQ